MDEALDRSLRQQALLAELGRRALAAGDADGLLQDACRLIASGVEAEFCAVLQCLPGESRLLLRAGIGWPGGVIGQTRAEAERFPSLQATRNEVAGADPATRGGLPDALAGRVLDAAITDGAGVFGVLVAADPRPDVPAGWAAAPDPAFLRAAAALLGAALERFRADEAAAQARLCFRASFEQAATGMTHAALDGMLIRVNDPFCAMTGYSREELLLLNVRELTHPEERGGYEEAMRRLAAGEMSIYRTEKRYLRKDGSILWANLTASLVRDGDGRPGYLVAVVEDIGQRKQAEADAEAAHRRTGEILESISDAFYAVDREWRFTYVNRRTEELWKRRREELIGKVYWEEFPQAVGSPTHEAHLRAARERRPVRVEAMSAIAREWVDVSIYPNEAGLSVYFRDIGARKRAEAELLAANARMSDILESIDDAFYALDAGMRLLYANRRAQAFWRKRTEDLLGRPFLDIFPEAAGSPQWQAHERALRDRAPARFEIFSLLVQRWVTVSIYPAPNGGITVYFRDISERRQAEDALRESEGRLRLALKAGGLGSWEVDLARRTGRWSPETAAIHGAAPTEGDLPVDDWVKLIHPDDLAAVRTSFADTLARHGDYSAEYRIIRPDGEVRWTLAQGSVLRDERDQPARVVGVVQDVTERRQAEDALRHANQDLERHVLARTQALAATVEELRQSRERYGVLFEHAPVDLVLVDVRPDGRFVYEQVNPSLTRHTGIAAEAYLGHTPQEVLDPELAACVTAHYRECVETRQPVEYEVAMATPGGQTMRRAFLVPLREAGGAVGKLLLTVVDVTEMRQIEAQLRQAQKMEAIGQLTGGVAHDFNNLLTAVIGNLELLRRHATDERSLRRIDTAMRAARRGGELTHQLLAYARKQNLTPRPVDANAVIAGMGDLLQRSLGGLVQVEADLAPDLWHATSDPTQLELLVLNLGINARDAMPEGGRLRIATRNLPKGAPLPSELDPGEYVLVSVADEGTGMTPEVLEKAMEPFFTTKEVGRGSGLGLAQVYGVARQFGGTVRLRSAPGAGTTVEIFLPRAEPPAAEAESAVEAPAPPAARIRVLVVDDDPDVRAVAAAFLEEGGYDVREAESGAEALAAMEAEPVDLALVDYAMAGMPGTEFVRQARQRWPGLRVVYVTGNAEPLGEMAAGAGDPVLGKPYRMDALLEVVRAAVGAGGGRTPPPGALPLDPIRGQSSSGHLVG